MPNTSTDVFSSRAAIKAVLPQLYDAFWSECDRGEYFNVPIPTGPLTRLRPRNMLVRSGTRVIRWAYGDVIGRAAMALAAEATAADLEDAALAAYFRFVPRNRDAADALRGFIRFLDQCAYHLYEVSGRRFPKVKTAQGVSFARLEEQLPIARALTSRRITSAAQTMVSVAKEGFTEGGWTTLQKFRNVDTHRFVVGIDHIVYGFGALTTGEGVPRGGYTFGFGDPADLAYVRFAEPDIRFGEMQQLLRGAMHNAKGVITALARTRLLIESETL